MNQPGMSKKRKFQSISLVSALVLMVLLVAFWRSNIHPDEASASVDNFEIKEDPASENPEARWLYEFNMLKDPATGKIPEGMRKREIDFTLEVLLKTPAGGVLQSESAEGTENSSFVSHGPYNLGGRTRALALDINDEDIVLAGGVSGGIWRSTDGGQSWTKTSSPRDFPSVSVLVQDRRAGHTSDWYFGGGEIIGNSAAAPSAFYYGDGIYRSTDGGLSWNLIPATEIGNNVDFSTFSVVNEMAIDLSNTAATEIYVANPRGIIRTTDNFANAPTVLGASNTGLNYSDVAVSPTGVVYAVIATSNNNGANAEEGVFMSADGISWTNIDPPTGLPSSYIRAELAIDPNDENIVYLVGGNQAGNSIDDFLFRYNRSTNNWTDLSDNMDSSSDIGEGHNFQQGYNLYARVHPGQSNTVFTGGTNLLRSTDAFGSAANISQVGGYQPDNNPNSFGSYIGHHPDQHTAVFLSSDPNVMITGSDGGLHRTDNNLQDFSGPNPVQWQSLNNGYHTTQFYAIDMLRGARGDMRIPGGMQDNGSWINYTNDPAGAWTRALGGDGSFSAITHNSLYMSAQEGQLRRYELNTGTNEFTQVANVQPSSNFSEFLFINPFIVDPVHREKLFVGAEGRVYFTRDITQNPGSGAWQSITVTGLETERVSALAASIQPEGVLYFGTRNGSLYKVNDTRKEATGTAITSNDMPDGATVSSIAVDPADADRVFVTFSNYNVVSIWMSEDGGQNWASVSGNLEENANGSGAGPSVRWIELLPDGNGGNLYFVATSVGLFMTPLLNGESTVWTAQSDNLIGRSLTNMIKLRPIDGQVAVSTHGNGVFVGTYEVRNSPTINYSVVVPNEEVILRGPTSSISGQGFIYQWRKDGTDIPGATSSTYTVTEAGTYTLRIIDERDDSVAESNELVFLLDGVAPVLNSVTRLDPLSEETEATEVTFQLSFSEPVNNLDVSDFAVSGSVSGVISAASPVVANEVFNVTVSSIGGEGTLGLSVVANTDIEDVAGNSLSGTIPINETYTIADNSVPTLAITRLDPTTETTNRSEVSFRLVFSEEVTNVDATDFELSGTSVSSAGIESLIQGASPGAYTVAITGIAENGLINLDLVANQDITDLASNDFAGDITIEETFTIANLLITSIDNGQSGTRRIKVMRNPSSGLFKIVLSEEYFGGYVMNVVNASGVNVFSKEEDRYQSGAELEIDLTRQPDAVYLLTVANGDRRDVVRLLKRSN
ncbi:MAG: T9SS type A sorting domain-containing protein [Roseivirga sp.]